MFQKTKKKNSSNRELHYLVRVVGLTHSSSSIGIQQARLRLLVSFINQSSTSRRMLVISTQLFNSKSFLSFKTSFIDITQSNEYSKLEKTRHLDNTTAAMSSRRNQKQKK